MEQIFIIQRFDLNRGSMLVSPVYFTSESEANHYVDELKRIISESLELELPIVEQRHVFNVLTLDSFK